MARYKIYFEHVSSDTNYPEEDFGYLGHDGSKYFDDFQEAWRFSMKFISETTDPWDWNTLDIKVSKPEQEIVLLRVTSVSDDGDEWMCQIEEVPD